jgi:hypothetical protein
MVAGGSSVVVRGLADNHIVVVLTFPAKAILRGEHRPFAAG